LLIKNGGPFQFVPRPIIAAIVSNLGRNVATGPISARFQLTMSRAIAASCDGIRASHGLTRVCLSGGTFQNLRLLVPAVTLLRESGFEVFTHHRVPHKQWRTLPRSGGYPQLHAYFITSTGQGA
jgi:hydrogenase maturation protein HypF